MHDKILVYKGIERLALEEEKGGACYVAVFRERELKESYVYSSLEDIARLTADSIAAKYQDAHKNLRQESEIVLAFIVYDGQLGTLVQRLAKDGGLKLPERTRLIDLVHLTEAEIKEFKDRVLRDLTTDATE